MANNPIDFVIPFLDPTSETWQHAYAMYKNQLGIKGNNRFRDWGTMRYVLRGIEYNCPWFNKIHIILFDESMIPNWLDTTNERIHIVFHKDYIPVEYVPTFSSSVIELFVHLIPGLSENFVYSCDDMLILNRLPDDYFFKNNKPVSPLKYIEHTYLNVVDDWCCIENNNYRLEAKLLGNVCRCDHPHFQIPFNKSFIQWVWSKLSNELISGLQYSKFRNKHENQIWLFDDLQRLLKHAITNQDIFSNAMYYWCNNGDFSCFRDKSIVCFNDTDYVTNYEVVKAKFISYMESVLPMKSSFEL